MRASQFLLKTTKDDPAEAEIVSHRLMLRSGMIKKVAAGLYSWLPVGLRDVLISDMFALTTNCSE